MEAAQKAMFVRNVCNAAKAVHSIRNSFCKTQSVPAEPVFPAVQSQSMTTEKNDVAKDQKRRRMELKWSRCYKDRETVYVYDGVGTCVKYFEDIFTSLVASLDPSRHRIKHISPEEVISGTWRKECAAIVFGGGHASGFLHALGPKGVKHVRDFVVQDGGSYIGVCAGAYFACTFVEFDKGGKHEICLHRPLRFYPGTCKGPISHSYDPFTEKGSLVLPVSFRPPSLSGITGVCGDDKAAATAAAADDVISHTLRRNNDVITTVNAYVNGGGIFLPHPRKSLLGDKDGDGGGGGSLRVCKTLAYFQTLEHQPAAVVKCKVGRNGGVAVLLSPHLEGFASRSDDVTRQQCWRWVLRQGKLATVRSSPLPFVPQRARDAKTHAVSFY